MLLLLISPTDKRKSQDLRFSSLSTDSRKQQEEAKSKKQKEDGSFCDMTNVTWNKASNFDTCKKEHMSDGGTNVDG
jgi:hypothetical protein